MHHSHNTRDYKIKISVPWPRQRESTDPNYFYRSWLEEHAGRQYYGWDWEGGVGKSGDELVVYFMDPSIATMFLLTQRY